ncbi:MULTISPECIES: alpha/beta fold hydrolase [unclassified Bosea (in: a-proteobacteria)]|uniref:alpha/beta fold hydrolase n=1 Tax=unclassified Bosea (in: a-proteobacteria) TaxID=2653178 RepID=UPI0009558726|nr:MULTISPECIES: alpha/beta fold hydrolase [unclassified Bosea (in: a-proteobacteria)]TAJ34524.1 MAG: alpha/beta fold hydrolase [Bosea sp. (in: a-proteobacteria)]SIQ87380.1 Pimeloyl-ACP methyl ester carboxylesterase [Bosea sp. TND4EK4]
MTQEIIPFRAETDDGAVLQAYREGQGPALLLITGLGGTAGFWNDIAGTLGRSFQTLRFDQRGLVDSTRGSAPCDIDRLARDALAVLDAAGLDRAVVLGHSTGGCIAQAMANLAPERFDGLILSAAWLKACRYMTALFGSRRAILDCNPQAYAATSLLSAYQPRWIEAHWHVYEAAIAAAPVSEEARSVLRERIDALLAFDGTAGIAETMMPVLVMGARDDMVVPVYHQEALAAALPGCRRAIMETGGHLFPNSRPDFFTASVAEWIGEL